MRRLARLFGFGRSDFYGAADRAHKVPIGELEVATAALLRGGPIADGLLRQLREAPDVYRLRESNGRYELRISATIEVAGVPTDGRASAMIDVETVDGRALGIRLVLHEAGIIGLHGVARDGRRWPNDWRPTAGSIERLERGAPWLRLPTHDQVLQDRSHARAAIAAWLGSSVDELRSVEIIADPPALARTVAALGDREQVRISPDYEAFLLTTDGARIDGHTLLGTRDAYRLDIPGATRLVIEPPTDDGVVVIDEAGRVLRIDLDGPNEGDVIADDLQAYVRSFASDSPPPAPRRPPDVELGTA